MSWWYITFLITHFMDSSHQLVSRWKFIISGTGSGSSNNKGKHSNWLNSKSYSKPIMPQRQRQITELSEIWELFQVCRICEQTKCTVMGSSSCQPCLHRAVPALGCGYSTTQTINLTPVHPSYVHVVATWPPNALQHFKRFRGLKMRNWTCPQNTVTFILNMEQRIKSHTV